MFTKISAGYILFSLLSVTEQVLGRERWLERNNKPVYLYPRRFGQEQPAVLQKLRDACPGQVCGTLAGRAVTPLLAAQPECSQQDMADAIIDASRQFDVDTQENMVLIAQEYRQAEKNTPPDFSTNPPTLRNSVFCQKAPRNSELNGLVQAQDPTNDPDIFFDPTTNASVRKGDQPNTFPFNGGNGDINTKGDVPTKLRVIIPTLAAAKTTNDEVETNACTQTAVTVRVSGTNPAVATVTDAITVTFVGNPSQTNAPAPSPSPGGVDFGNCSIPEIEFGTGFDGKNETSFQPVDRVSFNHPSAQNINIITDFICNTLEIACKANQAARDLCSTATNAASSAAPGGAQADAFNQVFGITTNFAVGSQGNAVSGTGAESTEGNNSSSLTSTTTPTATATGTSSGAATSAPSPGDNGDFGSCSTPEIEFGAGFDGRRETSFQPANKASFNHGSAQGINIITQFICDQLTNTCGADQAAKDICAEATTAASNATPAGSGAQADAFNAVFGIRTNFASVQQIDDQGRPVGGTGNDRGNSGPNGSSTTTLDTSSSQTTPALVTTSAVSLASDVSGLQKFAGALGGIKAPGVRDLGSGTFGVQGTNSPFNDEQSALSRSCDVQNNQCADAANASGNRNGFTVQACSQQLSQCKTANGV